MSVTPSVDTLSFGSWLDADCVLVVVAFLPPFGLALLDVSLSCS